MRGRLLQILIVAAAALLLHLPAHFAPWTQTPLREALPEDDPVFVGNDALVATGDEGVVAAARRAAMDPSAAWSDAGDIVGASRWRPVSTSLFVAERAASWADTEDGAARGAAVVSLLLHVLVALGAMRLATSLGGDARAALCAGLVAAASPVALAAAAWPARQAAVLATALALGGTLLALRGGAIRLVAAGIVLALAGLAHEAAFGWVLAVPLLRRAASGGKSRALDAWPCAVVPVIAFAIRHSVLAGFAVAASGDTTAGALRGANALDGATGIVVAAVSLLVPVRTHFADGPFVFSFAAHAAAIVVLAAGVTWLARRAASPAAAAALAAVAASAPLLFVGVTGGAPYQDSYLYMVLPLAAAAIGLAAAAFAARRGAIRIAGVAAAAVLIAASAAVTASRAPSFRTRKAIIALAKSEMPESLVVRAWGVLGDLKSSPTALSAVGPDVEALAADAMGPNLPRVRRDAVAAATLGRLFGNYASALRGSPLPLTDAAYDAAEAAGAAAAELRPGSARAWTLLAVLRLKTGDLRGAVAAMSRALSLDPGNPGISMQAAEIALAVGNARFAADTMEHVVETLRKDPARPELTADILMLYARALAADGALRVPDPSSDKGLRYRYDLAADVLVAVKDIEAQRGPTSPATKLLYDVYLRYGDMLASIDRTAMALLSYQRAVSLTGGSTSQNAALHGAWLLQRLQAEEEKANKHLEAAVKDKPDDVGNAMLELYVSFCRQTKWTDADDAFKKLETAIGGVPPELRLQRAIHRYAALEDAKNQADAETELRRVLSEKPDLHRAEYELARVLEWQGTIEKLAEARDRYERSAREGVLEDWSLDADARAQLIADLLLAQAK